jgi:predicted porin
MRGWIIAVLALAVSVPAAAQDAPSPAPEVKQAPGVVELLGLTGAVRAGYWSSTRNLDSEAPLGAGMLWLKSSRRVSKRVSFLAEGWTSLQGPFEDGKAAGELREAFVDLRFGKLDVRAGRQIIAWGRADGVNPTDNLSGQDLTLLVPDDADRRLGATAVRASYLIGGVSVGGVWLPEFRGHEFALPAPPPGVVFARESDQWPGDQWALRVEQTGGTVDWSASYFDGKDLAPDLGVDVSAGILLSHHRVRVIGGDMTANLGRFGLRAEAAYVDTEDTQGRDPFTKNPFVFVVAGADRTFGGQLNLNVQYLYRQVRHRSGRSDSVQDVLNSQTQAVQHGVSFRIAHKWLHDTLEAECAAVAYAGPQGGALRPKLVYAVTDSWKVLAGAEILSGQYTSLFGLMQRNSAGFGELRWSF